MNCLQKILAPHFGAEQLRGISVKAQRIMTSAKNPHNAERGLRQLFVKEGLTGDQARKTTDALLRQRVLPGQEDKGYQVFVSSSAVPAKAAVYQPCGEPHLKTNAELMLAAARHAPTGKKALILGAGYMRDIPLTDLIATGKFSGFNLVDISQEAMDEGLRRFGLAGDPRLRTDVLDISLRPPEFYNAIQQVFSREKDPQKALDNIAAVIGGAEFSAHWTFKDAGFVTSSMCLSQLTAYLNVYLEGVYRKQYGEELNASDGSSWNDVAKRFIKRTYASHIRELSRVAAENGIVYISSDIIAFDPGDFLRQRVMVECFDGSVRQLTPALLLSEYRKMLTAIEENPLDADLQLPIWLAMLLKTGAVVPGREIAETLFPGLGLIVRSPLLNNPFDDYYLDPDTYEKIGGGAWLWELTPDNWSLVQGIILKNKKRA